MSDGGKGSKRRPSQISEEEEKKRWDAIFGKKDKKETLKDKEKENKENERN